MKQFWIRDECLDYDCYETVISNVSPTNEKIWLDFRNSVHVVDMDSYQQLLDEAKLLRSTMQGFTGRDGYENVNEATERFDRFLEQREK